MFHSWSDEKKNRASFSVAAQTANVAIARDKALKEVEKTWFLLLMQRFDGKAWFLLFCRPLKLYMILYSTGTVFFIALSSIED